MQNISISIVAIGGSKTMDLREWVGMDWTHLAQDRDQWKAPVNKLMNLRVGKSLSN
jgi:hypothetical protein